VFGLSPTLSAPLGSGKTIAYGLTRSGSAGAIAGTCGTRLQCFKAAIIEANTNTTPSVENVALTLIDQVNSEQDVNMKLSGKQLLIIPDADPSLNGQPDFVDAVNKVSLGGGTCLTCALKAANASFAGARATSPKAIVLVSERPNGFLPADGTLLSFMEFQPNVVIHAFAVGSAVTCMSDPFDYGSLAEAAALTPGGTCTNVPSFDGLGALLTAAINGVSDGPPAEDITPPAVTLTSPIEGGSTPERPTFSGAAGTAPFDQNTVTIKVWRGSDAVVVPLQTLVASVSAGTFSVQASSPLADGVYIAQAEQLDGSGNLGLSGFVSFTIAAEPPPPPPPPPPGGTGHNTVAWALSRSGSAGVVTGPCGTRLQCFKTAITQANASTASIVDNAALVLINVAEPEQDVNMQAGGKQLLVAPMGDPNGNGKPDFIDALDKVSLGGGTCFACALQAAEWSFEGAHDDTRRVIILISERINTFRSTGFTSGGLPTGYPPMELSAMTFASPNTVVHAFAVGPNVTCSADPNGYGSLNTAAALTPGGSCTNVASFEGLGAVIAAAVSR
jgi:hypothetical protein